MTSNEKISNFQSKKLTEEILDVYYSRLPIQLTINFDGNGNWTKALFLGDKASKNIDLKKLGKLKGIQ